MYYYCTDNSKIKFYKQHLQPAAFELMKNTNDPFFVGKSEFKGRVNVISLSVSIYQIYIRNKVFVRNNKTELILSSYV